MAGGSHFYHTSSCARVVLAVCLSVHHRRVCDKTKLRTADIVIPHERAITLVFWHQQWLVGDAPFHLKFLLKVTHPLWKCRLPPISAYNVSTVRVSKKVQLWRVWSRALAFQWAIDRVYTLTLSSQDGGHSVANLLPVSDLATPDI